MFIDQPRRAKSYFVYSQISDSKSTQQLRAGSLRACRRHPIVITEGPRNAMEKFDGLYRLAQARGVIALLGAGPSTT